MAAVPFDTLKLARRLEAAGFPGKQAGDTAEALAEAMSGAELATKSDLALVRADLDSLRADLRAGLDSLRKEFTAEIAALRVEFKADIELLRRDMELLRRDLTIRLGGMMVVAVGVLLAAIRYLPTGH